MKKLNRKSQAWKHFWPEGNGKAKPGYILHHINPLLKDFDPNRYDAWIIGDLAMMTNAQHTALHANFKYSGLLDYLYALAEEESEGKLGYDWVQNLFERYRQELVPFWIITDGPQRHSR